MFIQNVDHAPRYFINISQFYWGSFWRDWNYLSIIQYIIQHIHNTNSYSQIKHEIPRTHSGKTPYMQYTSNRVTFSKSTNPVCSPTLDPFIKFRWKPERIAFVRLYWKYWCAKSRTLTRIVAWNYWSKRTSRCWKSLDVVVRFQRQIDGKRLPRRALNAMYMI